MSADRKLKEKFQELVRITYEIVDDIKIYSIECPKGLWGVEGKNKVEVTEQAYYYFQRYEQDGEYEKNPTVTSVIH